MHKFIFFGLGVLVISGCTITQTVEPVFDLATNEICIIENPPVREGFLAELRSALQSKNARISVLGSDATIASCEVVVTYLARWKWDLALYLSYVEISVYRNGQRAGNALYDATKGGGRMDKFIDAEPKIRELVDELFPSGFPADLGGSEIINRKSETSAPSRHDTDLYSELRKLDQLRKDGLLTDDEFESEKKKLLDSN